MNVNTPVTVCSGDRRIYYFRVYRKDHFMKERSITYSKSKVRTIILGIILCSFYATGAFQTLVLPNYRFAMIPDVFIAFFKAKTSIILFPVLIILLGVGLGSYMAKTFEAEQREDLLGRGFRHVRGDQTYGNAKFLRPDEYVDAAQIRKLEDCKGIIVGQLKDNAEECVDFNPYEGRINGHMLAIGRSGGGKTFTFVLSYVFQTVKRRHSLIITDPKGDLYMQCAGYLRDNGYVVRTLNLKNPDKSDGWDLLAALAGPRLEENVAIFSHTLAVNMSDSEGGIYVEAGEALINALILKTMLDPTLKPEERKITTAYNMLLNPDGLAFLDTVFADENITEAEKPAQMSYLAFKNSSQNLLGNIITHVTVGLKLFQRKDICEMFTTPGIDMVLPGKQPCAYFVQFPDVHTTYKFLTALFFSMMFTYLTDYADLVEDDATGKKLGKLLTPVDFLLDEFPSIGTLPDWDSKMAVMRSRKINIVMIIQDFPQLVKRYSESWKTIVNNCGCILTLGINEPDDTASWISSRCGTATVEVSSSSTRSIGGSRNDPLIQQVSEGLGKRPLLNVDEVCTIDRDGSLLIITDHGAVYVHKFPYINFADSKKLYDTLPKDVISISDKANREIFEAAEREYLNQYWSEHEMHPNINYKDLSTAMYTERPEGPFAIAWDVVSGDIKTGVRFIKKKVLKSKKPSESSGKNDDYVFVSAEKGAFQEFYENYKKMHEVESSGGSVVTLGDSSFEDYDDFESMGNPEDINIGGFDDFDLDDEDKNADLKDFDQNKVDDVFQLSPSRPNISPSAKPKTETSYTASVGSASTPTGSSVPSSQDKEQIKRDNKVKQKKNKNRPDINFMNITVDDGVLPDVAKR